MARLFLYLHLVLCSYVKAFGNLQNLAKTIASPAPLSADEVGLANLKELGIEPKEPQAFAVRDPSQIPALVIASLPAVLRFASGVFAYGYEVGIVPKRVSQYTILTLPGGKYQMGESSKQGRTQQVEPLIVYEFEQCPFCRKVREAISMLNLSVIYKPCPSSGRSFRPEIKQRFGAEATFPFMQDPSTGAEMFESDAIVDYLFRTYGDGEAAWPLSILSPIGVVPAAAALVLGGGGSLRAANPPPPLPLELWSYEGSPFCKLVRERLCELEIPHLQTSCPRGSPNRQVMQETKGRFQVPYIEDPNTGVKLWESGTILVYLEKMYGLEDSPVEYL